MMGETDGAAMGHVSGGKKFDGGKLRMDLIPPVASRQRAATFSYGAEKYGPDNYKKHALDDGIQRHLAALYRHLTAWQAGEALDDESGLHHLAHAAANIDMIIWAENEKAPLSERWRAPASVRDPAAASARAEQLLADARKSACPHPSWTPLAPGSGANWRCTTCGATSDEWGPPELMDDPRIDGPFTVDADIDKSTFTVEFTPHDAASPITITGVTAESLAEMAYEKGREDAGDGYAAERAKALVEKWCPPALEEARVAAITIDPDWRVQRRGPAGEDGEWRVYDDEAGEVIYDWNAPADVERYLAGGLKFRVKSRAEVAAETPIANDQAQVELNRTPTMCGICGCAAVEDFDDGIYTHFRCRGCGAEKRWNEERDYGAGGFDDWASPGDLLTADAQARGEYGPQSPQAEAEIRNPPDARTRLLNDVLRPTWPRKAPAELGAGVPPEIADAAGAAAIKILEGAESADPSYIAPIPSDSDLGCGDFAPEGHAVAHRTAVCGVCGAKEVRVFAEGPGGVQHLRCDACSAELRWDSEKLVWADEWQRGKICPSCQSCLESGPIPCQDPWHQPPPRAEAVAVDGCIHDWESTTGGLRCRRCGIVDLPRTHTGPESSDGTVRTEETPETGQEEA
jgi:hypothetical protein